MTTRQATAAWKGGLMKGTGEVRLESGSYKGPYSFRTRFEDGKGGTNPEELIAAAHAGCYSMAFSHILESKGHAPESIETQAAVELNKAGEGFAITQIKLKTTAKVPGIVEDEFMKLAETAKTGCPVSKALAGCKILLEARLA